MRELQKQRTWFPSPVAEFEAVSRPTEYKDLINCPSPTLAAFVRQFGRKSIENIIIGILKSISDGLDMKITGDQLLDVCDEILCQFPDVKLSDLLLFKKEVLGGRVGGQVGDNLWKWSTRNMNIAFAEYYVNRQNVILDDRDQKYQQEKNEYQHGLARCFANASPETQQKHRDMVDKNNIRAILKKQDEEAKKEHIPSKMSLEQIAQLEGIDPELLAKEIRRRALARQHVEKEFQLPESVLLANEIASIQHYARKDSKYLHEIMNQN